jgi:hypothetical protein
VRSVAAHLIFVQEGHSRNRQAGSRPQQDRPEPAVLEMSPLEVEAVVRQVLAAEREETEKHIDQVTMKTMVAILTSFGIDDDERLEIKADFQHLRRSRQAYELVQKTGLKAAITVVITATLGAMWLGVTSMLHK